MSLYAMQTETTSLPVVTDDTRTIFSDITETNTTVSQNDKYQEIVAGLEKELSLLTADALKEKCKECGASGLSKLKKKTDYIQVLTGEFSKIYNILKDKKLHELKLIMKQSNIKGVASSKKEVIINSVLQLYAKNMKFSLDELQNVLSETTEKPVDKMQEKPDITPVCVEPPQKLTPIVEPVIETVMPSPPSLVNVSTIVSDELQQSEKCKEKEEIKKKKQTIPKNVKTIVWNHYIGDDIIKHRCLCCKKVVIQNTNFEVGHVLSEKNGGTHEINNLRPICGACNHSMGTENMVDFVLKYGLLIG